MLETAGYNNNGLHVFVFCCADYQDIIKDCVSSITQNVLDPILSYNLVSNTTINLDGYRLVKDKDFWNLLNPDPQHRNLYNHNWIKQQIFKLNLDRIVTGNILIIDAEVRFKRPVQWVVKNQYNIFYTERWKDKSLDSTNFIKQALNIDVDQTKNFIVEAAVFSSDILKEIRNRVETVNQMPQLTAYQHIIFDDPTSLSPLPKVFMSEYDMYANYLLKFHPQKLNSLIDLKTNNSFKTISHSVTSNSSGNQTKWLTFYEQIRDSSWPECTREEDFVQLPNSIQKEIIEVFGYKFNQNNKIQ